MPTDSCSHRHLHPGRYRRFAFADGISPEPDSYTVCLDCKKEVHILTEDSVETLREEVGWTAGYRKPWYSPSNAEHEISKYLSGRVAAAADMKTAPPWPKFLSDSRLLCPKDDVCIRCGETIPPLYTLCSQCADEDGP